MSIGVFKMREELSEEEAGDWVDDTFKIPRKARPKRVVRNPEEYNDKFVPTKEEARTFAPSKDREYVEYHGMQVGRWRCPECHRGVDAVGFCEIHGTMYIEGEQTPLDVLKDAPAWDTALSIRLHQYLQEHKGATNCDVIEHVGIDAKALCDHLDRLYYADDDITYRKEYVDLYGLVEGSCPCEPED